MLVNAAAYTNVERAEDDAETAYRVNEDGARLLAAAARESGLRFVHVSTDFVFDGTKSGAYVEDRRAQPALGLRRARSSQGSAPLRRPIPTRSSCAPHGSSARPA